MLKPVIDNIRVAGVDYAVSYPVEELRHKQVYGQTLHRTLEIKIDDGWKETKIVGTWLHEILHLVENYYLPDFLTEVQCEGLGRGIYQIFSDNPALREYVFNHFKGGEMDVKIVTEDGVKVPLYSSEGASGFDLTAKENCNLVKGHIKSIPTGMYVEVPAGFEMQIRSRSGLASKGIVVMNQPGTVDSDYRGEIKILLGNLMGEDTFTVVKGDRIAQGVICPIVKVDFTEVSELEETKRGSGGFGSTGV